jgi:hypothetical protein
LRKLRKEVLPDDRAPIMRILREVSFNSMFARVRHSETHLNGVGSFRLLTLRGLLMVLTALLA